MKRDTTSPADAIKVEQLQARLQEAEDTLDAIRQGVVDAVMVKQNNNHQVYTLRSADHAYRVLIESMNQGALTSAADGTVLYSNTRFSSIVGQPLEHIIGAPFQSFFKAEDTAALTELITNYKTHNSSGELELVLPGEEFIVVIVSATRLPNSNDNAFMGIVVTDITERKRAEKAKDEFISLASHQLRTPATAVKQYLGMILEGYVGKLPRKQAAFIETAYKSNEEQLAIINSILKTAQIDSGVYTLRKSSQNLAAMCEAVLSNFRPLLLLRKQQLTSSIDPAIAVEVDEKDFAIVISNLIENASKYSATGKHISLKAAQTPTMTTITVTDEGVGIDPADQRKVFEKFTRVDNALSDTVNGSGLGLYWINRIVIMHGGTVSLYSEPGRGTTFTISLPR